MVDSARGPCRVVQFLPGPFFDRLVGVDINLGRLHLLVPEPEGDRRGVHPGVQEPHGGGVPEHMGRDVL